VSQIALANQSHVPAGSLSFESPLNFSLEPRSISSCGRRYVGNRTRRARFFTEVADFSD
jgi:hypothetical protein